MHMHALCPLRHPLTGPPMQVPLRNQSNLAGVCHTRHHPCTGLPQPWRVYTTDSPRSHSRFIQCQWRNQRRFQPARGIAGWDVGASVPATSSSLRCGYASGGRGWSPGGCICWNAGGTRASGYHRRGRAWKTHPQFGMRDAYLVTRASCTVDLELMPATRAVFSGVFSGGRLAGRRLPSGGGL